MKRTLTIEHFLYLLAFLIGLFLRFYRLGLPALGESEAAWALQALESCPRRRAAGWLAARLCAAHRFALLAHGQHQFPGALSACPGGQPADLPALFIPPTVRRFRNGCAKPGW